MQFITKHQLFVQIKDILPAGNVDASLTLVDSDGSELLPHGVWHLLLLDGGRTLKFGALRGTQILIR
jgi:hypothetical protein